MLLFADPFSTPMQDVLTVIEERYPDARALGGLAGGGQDIGENRLFLDDQIYADGLVGVALSGNILVRSVISQGCRPIGDRFIVTKAEHNVIQELGGVPALHCLQTVFGQLTPINAPRPNGRSISVLPWMNSARTSPAEIF